MSVARSWSLPASPTLIGSKRWLVYRKYDDVFVFADVAVALHAQAVYSVIHESTTWGEFKRDVPSEFLPEIEEHLFQSEDEVEDEDRCHWEDDDAPFKQSKLPGLDHYFKPIFDSIWLGPADGFPNALIKAHNAMVAGSASPSIHWHVPAECGEAVAATLREWGYFVERTEFLEFC